MYRALLPPLSQEACAQLLQRLHICLADFGTNNQIAAIDVLLTLTVSCAHCLLPAIATITKRLLSLLCQHLPWKAHHGHQAQLMTSCGSISHFSAVDIGRLSAIAAGVFSRTCTSMTSMVLWRR